MMHATTEDTAESVLVPVLPADDQPEVDMHWSHDIVPTTQWTLMGQWGTAGYDAGQWPYVFFVTTHHDDEVGRLYGYGTNNRGEITTHWYRSEDACHKAITAEVFWHWRFGGADAPPNLTFNLEDLPEEHTTPWR